MGGGKEALEIISTGGRPSIVVSDIVMPGMDGLELAESLREARPELPVLFISAFSDRSLEGLPGEGPQDFLPKPFTAGELVASVR